jgi:hypothetical protein
LSRGSACRPQVEVELLRFPGGQVKSRITSPTRSQNQDPLSLKTHPIQKFIYRITDILYRGSLPSSIVLCPDDDLSMDGTSSIPCFPLRCLVGFPWPWMHPIGTRAWSFPGTGLVRPKPNRARHCHVFVRSVLPSCRHGSYAPLNPKATVATSSRSTRIRTAVRPDACVCCDASGESRGDRGGASVRATRPGAHHGRVAIAIGNTLHA